MWGRGGHVMEWGLWHRGWGSFVMIALWVGVITLVVLLVRRIRGAGKGPVGQHRGPERPLDILERRYAGGEIDREEYEEKKRALSPPA